MNSIASRQKLLKYTDYPEEKKLRNIRINVGEKEEDLSDAENEDEDVRIVHDESKGVY